jgi:hypothetical protein
VRASEIARSRTEERAEPFFPLRESRRRIPSAMRGKLMTWRHVLAAAAALICCLLAGCTAGYPNDGSSTPPTQSTAAASIPPGGITLAALGYLNGPIREFSLPRTAVIAAKVDQPNNVAAVISSPSPSEIRSYLLRALPTAGFEITADRPVANTMTFEGHGWSGSFTGDDRASAVLLRPR